MALLAVGGCDVPTTAPSVETDTGLSTPVVVNKTFSFLGSGKSEQEPLIDTTTAQFDSLFVVAESDQSLSIEEEVSSFDFGSLDQVLDEASAGLGVDASLGKPVIQGSGLATQDVSTQFERKNTVPPPTNSKTETVPVQTSPISFPASLLEVPTLEAADVEADKVKAVTLTSETTFDGSDVNRITFTLRNKDSGSPTLTDGNGNPPVVRVDDENGQTISETSFGSTVDPGTSETVEIGIEDERLGENSVIELTVDGHGTEDELDIELSQLRYREALLGGVTSVGVTATETNLSTRGGGSSSQFAGIAARDGTLELDVANQFAFPIQVDSLRITNHLQDSALPDSFPALDVFESVSSIDPGATETLTVDLADRGVAKGVDVRFKGALADGRDTLTVSASDKLGVSAGGEVTVGALYFWPSGEEVSAQGQVDFAQDRISFDQAEDFVELSEGTLALDNLVSEPLVGFDSFTVAFPDLRKSPYNAADQVTLDFSIAADTDPSVSDVDLSDVRMSPTGNVVDYSLQGTLEDIPPSEQTADNLRLLQYDDEIRGDVSVGALDVRAVEAGVNPFTVDVTPDADGNDRLDLANDQEASEASFGNFDGLADRIDGLQLSGTEVKFRTESDIGTDVQLYAALQGRNGTTQTFLAGADAEKSVTSTSRGEDFYNDGSQIATDDLIQLGVDAAPTSDPVTRSVQLTNDNSTVDEFLSTFPSSLRFIAQARLTGDADGRMRVRRPLTFDTGLSVAIPVRVDGSFTISDTIAADFSALQDLTDPTKNVTVSSAELRVRYKNGLPLGADAELVVLDKNKNPVRSLPGEGETIRVKPPAKADDGTAKGARKGKTTLNLSESELRDLAAGRSLDLRLAMDQEDAGGPATFRATDTIQLSLETSVKASVSTSN